MIDLTDHNPEWSNHFLSLKDEIMKLGNELIVDIEHIGSTSIKGAKAKDIIDVQCGINSFNDIDKICPILESLGFEYFKNIKQDHVPFHEGDYFSQDWEKRFFTGDYLKQRYNLHVRIYNSPNWNFAIHFREYLSTNEKARYAFMQFKERLAKTDIDFFTYCHIKDSVIDLMSLQFPR